jgi:hypothetical protein
MKFFARAAGPGLFLRTKANECWRKELHAF